MTLKQLLKVNDIEEVIDELDDGDLIQFYKELKDTYNLSDSSWYDNNVDPYIYDIYHTMEAEIVSRDLDIDDTDI